MPRALMEPTGEEVADNAPFPSLLSPLFVLIFPSVNATVRFCDLCIFCFEEIVWTFWVGNIFSGLFVAIAFYIIYSR